MNVNHVMYILFSVSISALLTQIPVIWLHAEPSSLDTNLIIQRIFQGHFESSSMAFLGLNDIIVLDKDEGKVFRVTHGIQSMPLLDVNVATGGYRGLLGVAVSFKENSHPIVFLYFTEAPTHDGDDITNNPHNPLGNRLYRYDLINNKLVNPRLLLDLPSLPGPRHAGGLVKLGPDKNLYVTIGDLDGTFRGKQYETMAQNYKSNLLDGRSGILVISQDGKPVGKGILGSSFPLDLYYAYGIRNSFGIDWDLRTGYLWDSENGPNFGDELNLVLPGFNSGWASVQGFWKPNLEDRGPSNLQPDNLINFDGRGTYSPPEFVWLDPVAPSAVKFINSANYGAQYKDDLLVGDANNGNIYDFNLDNTRQNLDLEAELSDKTSNSIDEMNKNIFATGFGKVFDIEIGPDGLLYVLSTVKHTTSIYKIALR